MNGVRFPLGRVVDVTAARAQPLTVPNPKDCFYKCLLWCLHGIPPYVIFSGPTARLLAYQRFQPSRHPSAPLLAPSVPGVRGHRAIVVVPRFDRAPTYCARSSDKQSPLVAVCVVAWLVARRWFPKFWHDSSCHHVLRSCGTLGSICSRSSCQHAWQRPAVSSTRPVISHTIHAPCQP